MPPLGLLIIISGPSGVGKGTICDLLIKNNPNLTCSISATTREPRSGEIDGVDYHFLSVEEFVSRVDKGDFLEWASNYGYYYGTLKSSIDRLRTEGKDIILEIDTKGAMQILNAYPDSISIFILPPSIDELEKRIINRGSETKESLAKRISHARDEISVSGSYSYVVTNDKVDSAVSQIEDIIRAAKAVFETE